MSEKDDECRGPVNVPQRMRGNNQLRFCGAEMIAIVQEYLSARMGSYAPFVTNVTEGDNLFVVSVTDEAPRV